jgi:hypothetical protein
LPAEANANGKYFFPEQGTVREEPLGKRSSATSAAIAVMLPKNTFKTPATANSTTTGNNVPTTKRNNIAEGGFKDSLQREQNF